MSNANEGLAALLAELERAANALSTARYLLSDPTTAAAVAANSQAQALLQLLTEHSAALLREHDG